MRDNIKNAQQHRDNVAEVKKFIEDIEKYGGRMPLLKKAIDKYLLALNTGGDVALAAQETHEYLKKYTSDLHKACAENPDPGERMVCEIKIDRRYQARAVKFVLDPTEEKSVLRRSIKKTICRYTPEKLEKMFGCIEVHKF